MGNTALKCTNKQMDDYYLIVKTVFGKTHFIKFGPVCPDIDALLEDFSVSYKKMDYKETKIYNEIEKINLAVYNSYAGCRYVLYSQCGVFPGS